MAYLPAIMVNILCTVKCKNVYVVYCRRVLYIVYCTCVSYIVYCTLCTLYSVYCTMCTVHCVLCTVHVYCTLCTVHVYYTCVQYCTLRKINSCWCRAEEAFNLTLTIKLKHGRQFPSRLGRKWYFQYFCKNKLIFSKSLAVTQKSILNKIFLKSGHEFRTHFFRIIYTSLTGKNYLKKLFFSKLKQPLLNQNPFLLLLCVFTVKL